MNKISITLSKKERDAFIVLILTGILALSYFKGLDLQKNIETERVMHDALFAKLNPFRSVVFEARSVYIMNLANSNELYTRHPDTVLPLASHAKIMTALVVLEHLPNDAIITIDKDALSLTGSVGFKVGERFDRDSLLTIMLVDSSNDAARALAKKTAGTPEQFVALMNEKARELGLTKTVFYNESGLDESPTRSGAYGTAREIAHLASYFYSKYPSIAETTKRQTIVVTSIDKNSYTIENTNTSIDRLMNLHVSKTGYTKLAGGNLLVVVDANQNEPVVLVVLGSSMTGRFDDIIRLTESAVQFFQLQSIKNQL